MRGTLQGQHERTLDMLEDMVGPGCDLARVLWFMYDSQTLLEDLKALAVKAQARQEDANASIVIENAKRYLFQRDNDFRYFISTGVWEIQEKGLKGNANSYEEAIDQARKLSSSQL